MMFQSSVDECLSYEYFAYLVLHFFFFKQKTAYEMRISDWSSDVCSSYLVDVSEPSVEDTIGILRGLKVRFEQHHNIEYSDEALRAAAELARSEVRRVGKECGST